MPKVGTSFEFTAAVPPDADQKVVNYGDLTTLKRRWAGMEVFVSSLDSWYKLKADGVTWISATTVDASGKVDKAGDILTGILQYNTNLSPYYNLRSLIDKGYLIEYVSKALTGAVTYQGTWNANTNIPTLASSVGTKGFYYVVDTNGATTLDGLSNWIVGDWVVYNGTIWQKVNNQSLVSSVNGQAGAVVLNTNNIPEGSSQYFTELRVQNTILSNLPTPSNALISNALSLIQNIANLQGQINNLNPPTIGLHPPLGTLSELKLLDTTSVTTYPDRWLIFVETLGLYYHDRQSILTGDDNNVITSNVGRWIKLIDVNLSSISQGTFTGDGTTLSFPITHNINDTVFHISIFDQNGVLLRPIVTATSTSVATITFTAAPANGSVYKYIISKAGGGGSSNGGGGGGSVVSDVIYNATSWDGDLGGASKNAIRDKFVINDAAIAANSVNIATNTANFDNYLPLAGGTMSGYILTASGYGIDTTATSSSDVLNIGTGNADIINIGRAGATVNILGAVINEYATNAYVTDKLITLNSGGGASTGIGVGFEIEEAGTITGYLKTNSSETGFEFKSPSTTGVTTLITGSNARTLSVGNTGTIAVTSDLTPYLTSSVAATTYVPFSYTGTKTFNYTCTNAANYVNLQFQTPGNTPYSQVQLYGSTGDSNIALQSQNYLATLVSYINSSISNTNNSSELSMGISTSTDSHVIRINNSGIILGLSAANKIGYFGSTPITQQTLTGSWNGNAAGKNLASLLYNFGIIIDSSTLGTAPSGGTTSPLTTKGDIWGYSTVNARLAIGANATYLKADSTTATGLVWGVFGTDVLASVLTGYSSSAGTVSAADSILSAFNKLNGNVAVNTAAINGKLSTALNSGNIFVGNTSNVATGVAMSGEASISNLGVITLTNSAVTSKTLSGLSIGSSTSIAFGDSILVGFGKVQAQINTINSAGYATVSYVNSQDAYKLNITDFGSQLSTSLSSTDYTIGPSSAYFFTDSSSYLFGYSSQSATKPNLYYGDNSGFYLQVSYQTLTSNRQLYFPDADGVLMVVPSSATNGYVLTADSTTALGYKWATAATGGGTVTAVGITSANGISGTSSGGATPSLTLSLGAITPTTVRGLNITTTTGTLTITNAKTLSISNILTLSGTDGSTLNIGTGGTLGTAAYTAASSYEVPLTFSTGLTRTVNSITIDATVATLLGAQAFTNKTGYNGLVITSNTGVITTGTWNGTAISDTYISSASNWNNRKVAIASYTSFTGSLTKTTLYSIVIPANTLKAGSSFNLKYQYTWNTSSTAFTASWDIGAVNILTLASGAGTTRSARREQDVYINHATNANNTIKAITSGTSDQEGVINSYVSKDTIDWTVAQTLVMSITLGSTTDVFELIGAKIDFVKQSDTL